MQAYIVAVRQRYTGGVRPSLDLRLVFAGALLVVAVVVVVALWLLRGGQPSSSTAPQAAEMRSYDVQHVALDITVVPAKRWIDGTCDTTVRVTGPLKTYLCDLDGRLHVIDAQIDGRGATFRQHGGMVRVPIRRRWKPGETHRVRLHYRGRPRVAVKPPWGSGFVWARTPEGHRPWIGVTCEEDGGDVWWPCKDDPADEPDDGMDIALTVPTGLVGLSNGRPLGSTDNGNGTTTSRWHVSYPINNYDVTVNVGPYRSIEEQYHGVDGDLNVPILFWALPEHLEEARRLWNEAPGILEVLGRRFGEYPFLRDKYWAVESPYLGMEHQTLIAYGGEFADNAYGFDTILLHETAHEWWGNKITAAKHADLWLHEGFATYAEALYVNDTQGVERYLEYMHGLVGQIANKQPVVQGGSVTAARAFTRDIYTKGAWVLHTLRWLVGDEAFFGILHDFPNDPRFAYSTVTARDFTDYVDSRLKRDLSWFWERYLYRAALPEWSLERQPVEGGEKVTVSWDDPSFRLPLPVRIGGRSVRLQMSSGRGEVFVPHGSELRVDPDGWVLARAAH